jgi:hypothetical protein
MKQKEMLDCEFGGGDSAIRPSFQIRREKRSWINRDEMNGSQIGPDIIRVAIRRHCVCRAL